MGHDAALPSIFESGYPTTDADLSFASILGASEGAYFPLPARFTLIGLHDEDPHDDFYLDEVPDPAQPRIVRFGLSRDPASIDGVLAGDMYDGARSLEDLVFASAVASHVFPRFSVRVRLHGGNSEADGLEAVDQVFEQLGFVRHPALQATSRYHARSDAVALVQEGAKHRLFIELHAQSVATVRSIGPHIQQLGPVMGLPEEKKARGG